MFELNYNVIYNIINSKICNKFGDEDTSWVVIWGYRVELEYLPIRNSGHIKDKVTNYQVMTEAGATGDNYSITVLNAGNVWSISNFQGDDWEIF